MKFVFDGPMCFITEVGSAKKNVNILVPRLVKDAGDFRMNLSDPAPKNNIHWVSVYISKKDTNGEKVIKPVHVECDSYEQVIALVDGLQARHGFLIKQFRIEERKPWLRAHRLFTEQSTTPKETTDEIPNSKS